MAGDRSVRIFGSESPASIVVVVVIVVVGVMDVCGSPQVQSSGGASFASRRQYGMFRRKAISSPG